jgi:hypothetical protein
VYDHLDCPKQFRLFTKAEGAEGHCEGMAPTVFWDAAFNWLDTPSEADRLTTAARIVPDTGVLLAQPEPTGGGERV